MNGLFTGNNGGHPAHLDDLRWIDDGIRQAFKGVMSAFGVSDQLAVILKGCSRSENAGVVTISEGYVSIGGEICFVPSHSYQHAGTNEEYFLVKSEFDQSGLKQYQSGVNYDTYEARIGEVKSVAQGNVPAGHTIFQDAKNLFQIIDSKVDAIPVGTVLMWSGDIQSVPAGYNFCDGQNGTPDLRSRFIICQDPRPTQPAGNPNWDANYNSQGATGGEKAHQLSQSELPPHFHEFGINTADNGGGIAAPAILDPNNNLDQGNAVYPMDQEGRTKQTGNGASHNNIPPYYVLAYIIKTTSKVPDVI